MICALKPSSVWYRKDIVRRFRANLKDERDIHSRLMQAYDEVPHWWFAVLAVVSFALFCVSIEIFPTRLPIWAAAFGVIISVILTVPLAILQAMTNQQIPTQGIDELIAGYILPGRPIANMIFKTLGIMTTTQSVSYASDLKLGHYMKIPPRLMFSIQTISTVISCIWVIIIQQWMITNIEDVCSPLQKDGFTCPASTSFATASVVWGAIGPTRLYSVGAQ